MRRHPIAFALFIASGFSALGLSAHLQKADASGTQPMLRAQALDQAPGSRMEAVDAMDSAIAAAVIGAVAGQFDEDAVSVKLEDIGVEASSFRERALQGNGELKIGLGSEWIPFQFGALYDTSSGIASYPRLTIGAGNAREPLALDSGTALTLRARTASLMAQEFSEQPVSFSLDTARSSSAGSRYLRVDASGTADFGADGNAVARVHGLYDPQGGRWLRVSYEFGGAAVEQAVLAHR